MRTRTIDTQFSVLRASDRQPVLGGRMANWLKDGGEGGIRTPGTLLGVHTISSRAPSTGLGHLSSPQPFPVLIQAGRQQPEIGPPCPNSSLTYRTIDRKINVLETDNLRILDLIRELGKGTCRFKWHKEA